MKRYTLAARAASLLVAAVLTACSQATTNPPVQPMKLLTQPAGYHESASMQHASLVAKLLHSSGRHIDTFVQTNCLDWYKETTPGIEDPEEDQYLGTTCDTMWIPDTSLSSPNPVNTIGGGGGGGLLACTAANTENCVARESSCNGGRALNSSANGQDGHDNMISGEFEDFLNIGGVIQPIGWEYQTYGGQEYFQFAISISVSAGGSIGVVSVGGGLGTTEGPIVPYDGSVYNAFMSYLNMLQIAKSALPSPWNQVSPTTRGSRVKCGTTTANG